MKVTALIPARGGSKSIPLKNIKNFCGQPLLYWNLKAIEDCSTIDEVYVATDSDEIEKVVKKFDFKKTFVYRRSAINAQDTSSTESVMLEFVKAQNLKVEDSLVLVQATSPFTKFSDFDAAFSQLRKEGGDSLLTCALIKRFVWNSNGVPLNYDYMQRPRRQDFDGLLMENGAFYINSVGNFLREGNRLSGKISVYKMPEYTATELDEADDWLIAEMLMYKHVLPAVQNKTIKLFLSDIDGVLTDAGMYYSEKGDELKKFSTYDGKAFELLRKAGIKTGLITAENRKLNQRRGEKLNLDFIFQGITDKLTTVRELCKQEGISMQEVAYIGDDLNDYELLQHVGIAASPANAFEKIKNIPRIHHLSKNGGEGAVREFVEFLIGK